METTLYQNETLVLNFVFLTNKNNRLMMLMLSGQSLKELTSTVMECKEGHRHCQFVKGVGLEEVDVFEGCVVVQLNGRAERFIKT